MMAETGLAQWIERRPFSPQTDALSTEPNQFQPEPEETMDELFREANIEANGKVKYDEFIQKIAIPVPDY